MSAPRTLLMLCSSLGLGNSTRLMGVAQAIRHRFRVPPEALRIVVGSGGKAASFWSVHAAAVSAETLALDFYRHPERPESAGLDWGGIASLENAGVYVRNCRRLRAFLKAGAPDLAVIDSDYHLVPLLAARTPVVALGQAWDVLRRGARAGASAGIPARSMLVERLDFLFQRAASRRVLAPAFEPAATGIPGVEAVPLIVREEFTAPPAPAPAPPAPVQMLLSGSGIGAARMLAYAERHGLPVIRSAEGSSWSLDGAGRPLIDRAPAVIIQGGLSSISECVARRRKMIVVPIAGHAEQLANAFEVERLGLGVGESGLSVPPAGLLARLEGSTPASDRTPWPRTDGAEVVARKLLETLGLAA